MTPDRLRKGLQAIEAHYKQALYPQSGGTEYSKAWHDGYVTALATCSLIASEHLVSADEWTSDHTEQNGLAAYGTDKQWFEKTGYCGHCGNLAGYCQCTPTDPCGCGPHEKSMDPLRCWVCAGTGWSYDPREKRD